MDKSGRRALSENIARFIQESGKSRSAWAHAHKLDLKSVERVEKDAGEKGVGLSYVDVLAHQLRLEPWQLLVPELDLKAPPVLSSGQVQRRLSGGAATLLLAQAFAEVPERPRRHAAHLVSEMIENGPDESQASAIDALATIDVSLPLQSSSAGQSGSHFGVESLDLDQDLAATLQDLAVLSQTMTPAQRRAMVAALRGIKETPWDSTDDSSRKYIEREREVNLGPRQAVQPARKVRRS